MDKHNVIISMVGASAVGKTCIIEKMIYNIFREKYSPTIEDMYRRHVTIGGVNKIIDIVDSSGTEQFAVMRDIYLKSANCVILVFSIISRASLNELDEIAEQIQLLNPTVPKIILANKADLEQNRIILKNEYEQIENKFGGKLYETSAKNGKSIDIAMYDAMVRACIRKESLLKREEINQNDTEHTKNRCTAGKCIIL